MKLFLLILLTVTLMSSDRLTRPCHAAPVSVADPGGLGCGCPLDVALSGDGCGWFHSQILG